MATNTKQPIIDPGLERRHGENLTDYVGRLRAWALGDSQVPRAREERLAALERILRRQEKIGNGQRLPDDSVELLRKQREDRSRSLLGE